MAKKLLVCTALLLWGVAIAPAQHMFDYGDIRAGRFDQKNITGLRSMADGEHYTVLTPASIDKYSYKTGEKVETIFDFSTLEDPVEDYAFSANERGLLLKQKSQAVYRHSSIASYRILDTRTGNMTDLTGGLGMRMQEPQMLWDGSGIVFVADNNLWYSSCYLPQFRTYPITTDGEKNRIINGHTDWVYEEEYGFTRAFEISHNNRWVAYLRFDETHVPEVSIERYTDGLYPRPLVFKYPKAGEANSAVTLHVFDLHDSANEFSTHIQIDTGTDKDQYIPRIGWTDDGCRLFFYTVNRKQNRLRVYLCDRDFNPSLIYEEEDRRYVERPDENTVTFLSKDRFLVMSERSGYRHLYVHSIEKGVTDTLTRGNWEVTELVGVTPDRVYYLSNEGSVIRNNLYNVKLNGKGKTRLTDREGWYSISPSAGFKYFISRFSSVATPLQVSLHNASGKLIRTLEDNAELQTVIRQRNLPRKEFFRFKTERGESLNGYMIKPRNFDPAKKYPVMMTQYSGPGSQQVRDRWSVDWTDVLVQEGYVVVCVDGRGTGGRGAAFRKVTYRDLGGPETQDQISAAKYLATQPWVDMKRIGIYGWSYGGFTALNCILKGSDIFKMAIAVAPVTSWRFYDTIYTEIYNDLPGDNARGYDENSPINYADLLKGKLLIVHGTADDNVHFQNTMAMARALTAAGRQFDMMVYPDDNHSMMPSGRHHVRDKMIEYTLENL